MTRHWLLCVACSLIALLSVPPAAADEGQAQAEDVPRAARDLVARLSEDEREVLRAIARGTGKDDTLVGRHGNEVRRELSPREAVDLLGRLDEAQLALLRRLTVDTRWTPGVRRSVRDVGGTWGTLHSIRCRYGNPQRYGCGSVSRARR